MAFFKKLLRFHVEGKGSKVHLESKLGGLRVAPEPCEEINSVKTKHRRCVYRVF